MKTTTTAALLTYAGALPFLGLALVATTGTLEIQAELEPALRVYSALIVSFLCGIHWQIGISGRPAPGYLLWVSNAAVLASWWIVLALSGAVVWVLLAAVFAGLLLLDRGLLRLGLVARWFYRLRVRISAVVIASLLAAAAAARIQ